MNSYNKFLMDIITGCVVGAGFVFLFNINPSVSLLWMTAIAIFWVLGVNAFRFYPLNKNERIAVLDISHRSPVSIGTYGGKPIYDFVLANDRLFTFEKGGWPTTGWVAFIHNQFPHLTTLSIPLIEFNDCIYRAVDTSVMDQASILEIKNNMVSIKVQEPT